MLEKEIVDQLTSVFQKLEGKVELVYAKSNHEKQVELIEMLEQVASTSDNISQRSSGIGSSIPAFEIVHNGVPNGIRFSGIPGGH
jgi:alkyl hydroperoxide reductase subunit F